jgi:hypothetical protein
LRFEEELDSLVVTLLSLECVCLSESHSTHSLFLLL